MNSKTLLSVVAGLTVSCGSLAVAETQVTPVVWTNLVNGTSQWGDAANWVDADGNCLTVAPTNAADRFAVTLVPRLCTNGVKTITTGEWKGADSNVYLEPPAVDPSIESITGGVSYVIQHTAVTTYKQQKERRFTVANPNGFLGWWSTGDANAWFVLPATETFEPVLQGLRAAKRPYVDVPGEGTTAAVAALADGGTVDKMGAGKLRIGPSTDPSVGFIVEDGTLEFDGQAEGELARVLATAALHLDASVTNSMEFTSLDDYPGYTFVNRWNDVRGNGLFAYAEEYSGNPQWFYAFTIPPFISKSTSPTGLPLVDFGARFDTPELGPSNCVLRLSQGVTGISDAFAVEWDPLGGDYVTLLGGVDGLTLDYNRVGSQLCGPYAYQLPGMFEDSEFVYNGGVYQWNDTALNLHDQKSLYTFGISTRPLGRVQMLGTDRHYTSRSNRTRTGEIILFTNSLSRTERLLVARYLDAKWRTGVSDGLVAGSAIVKAAASVSVAAGRTAEIEAVTAADGTFVKTGEGELVVGQVNPAGSSIEQASGTIRFASSLRPPTTDLPADGAYLWLDASADNAFDFEDGSDTRVTVWHDRRAEVDLVATAEDDTKSSNAPVVVDGPRADLKAVSTGLSTQGDQAYFALPTWNDNTAYAYAGFMVMRPTVSGSGSRNYFGSSDLTMMRNSTKALLSGTYKQAGALAARWTINGETIDPMAAQSPYTEQTNDFFVLSFRSSKPLVMNAINKDRRGQQNTGCGNLVVGEFIVYHRPLSMEEFRDTEAYLMDKWLGKPHPANEPVKVARLASANPDTTVIDTDRPLEIGRLDVAGSSLTKRGNGSATVRQLPFGAASSALTVEGGSLATRLDFDPDQDEDEIFHFDASDLASLRYTVSGDHSITNVQRWYDVRGNGQYARSEWDAQTSYKKYCVADPTLVTKEVAPGVFAPALDFGDRRNTSSGPETVTNSAAMRFYGTDDKDLTCNTVRETFVIVAQRGTGYNNILGSTGTSAPTDPVLRAKPGPSNYMRSGAALVNANYCYPSFTNTAMNTVFVDGERVVGNVYQLTEEVGFQMLEFRPGGDTQVNALVLDRNCNAGGCYLCEVIGFSRELTDDERTSLRAQLRHKWFGKAAPQTDIAAVTVASGATLDVGDSSVVAKTLSGGGVLKCSGLTVRDADDKQAELKIGWRSPADVDGETVLAPASFPNGVHVTVTFEYEELRDVTPGEWTIFTANDLTLDPSALTVEDNLNGRRRVSVFVRGNTIVLKVEPRGSLLIIR